MSGSTCLITTTGTSGNMETFAPKRVIGNYPLRQFLVEFPNGRFQTLEAAYDPKSKDWFNVFGDEDRKPGEWGHWTGRGMNWNAMCASCHNTRVDKGYHEATDSYVTKMAEPTVSCESCHGPMKAHVQWQQAGLKQPDPSLKKQTPHQIMENCAACHARRTELTGDFKPGDKFHDNFSLVVVDESDTYYPDGQVRDENFEYAAFSGSKMHAAGVTCNNCHEPHTAKLKLPGNLMCMSCHSGGYQNAPKIDPAAHSFHQVDPLYATGDIQALTNRPAEAVHASGGECINCHMPQTYYMQRHRRHDHGFTTPDPLLTKEHGIPNACNRCHTDKSADWALEWTDKWYGQKMDRPSRHRAIAMAEARKGEPAAKNKLLALLKSGTEIPYWKASAANLLERWVAEPDVLEALISITTHESPLVRAHAAVTLGSMVGSGLVEPTLDVLLNDPTRDVRYSAQWALRARLDPQSMSLRELRETMEISADQPNGQMQKGAFFFSRNELEQSIFHYRKAMEWTPDSATVRHDLAVALSAANRPSEALGELQTAARLEPENADIQYKMALVFSETGNTEKALEALQVAVKLDPTHARAWYNLGLLFNSINKTDEALRALVRAETIEPNQPRAPYARATILLRLGRTDEARKAAQKAGNYPPAQNLLLQLGKP